MKKLLISSLADTCVGSVADPALAQIRMSVIPFDSMHALDPAGPAW